MKQILKWLKKHEACKEGYIYSKQFTDPKEWWDNFERGDWMLWVLYRCIGYNDETQLRKITLAKARCAKLVIHLMKDDRSRNAVEVAERFGKGEATREELDAAYAAAVAAYAADAADAAAVAAYAAADAADAADAAYAAAADAAAREDILKKCAGIIKELYTADEVVSLIQKMVA